MRRALDALFRGSEAAAALLVFLIFSVILLQVLFSILDRVALLLGGGSPGLTIPAYAEISAYLLAGAMFLALAGTLASGVHVRVVLLLETVPRTARRMLELCAGAIGALASAYFSWRAGRLTYESWLYGDLSYGQIVIPMWLPQLPMAIGLTILTLAFVDYVVRVSITGGKSDQGE